MTRMASYMVVVSALFTCDISASQEPPVTIEMIQALVEAEIAVPHGMAPLPSHEEPENACGDGVCADGASFSLLQRKASAAQAKAGKKRFGHVNSMLPTNRNSDTGKEIVEIPSIGLAKVHKTGGSTMKKIIVNLMTARGRRVMSPVDFVHLGWPKPFPGADNFATMGPPARQYDAIVDHAIFDAERFKSYLTSSPVFVGCLREPMAQAKSSYNYFRIQKDKGAWDVPDNDEQSNDTYIPGTWEEHLVALESLCSDPVQRTYETARFCNPQAYDLGWYEHVGLTTKYDNNVTMIKQWIKSLESYLGNIVLTEAFDEGLVLLRDLLNVNITELTYLRIRSGSFDIDPPQDEKFQKRLREMYHVDLVLYDHFNQSFWNQWSSGDVQDRNDQLAQLKKANSDLNASCVHCDPKKAISDLNSSGCLVNGLNCANGNAVGGVEYLQQQDAQVSFVQKKASKLIHVGGASELEERADSISNPSCLQEEQKKGLIDRIHNNTSLNVLVDGHVDAKIEHPNATGGVVWISYHKSGYALMSQLKNLTASMFGANDASSLASLLGDDFFSGCYALPMEKWVYRWTRHEQCSNSINIISATPALWLYIDNPKEEWTAPANVRVVYAFRDPVKLVLSGYRYHAACPEPSWELSTAGAFGPGETKCFNCDEADFNLLFSACPNKSNTYSYLDLLSSYPEEDGVMVEFIRARNQLQTMFENLNRWMNDRNALVLSIEHFATDFNQTAICLLRFLGQKDDAQGYSSALSRLQDANIHSDSYNSRTEREQHLTAGRYNNTKLENSLREHPILGPKFAEIRTAAEAIYQRQSKMYGCPMPSL